MVKLTIEYLGTVRKVQHSETFPTREEAEVRRAELLHPKTPNFGALIVSAEITE